MAHSDTKKSKQARVPTFVWLFRDDATTAKGPGCDEGTNLRLRDFAVVPLMPTRVSAEMNTPKYQQLPHHPMQILVNFEIELEGTCILQSLPDTILMNLLNRFLVSFTDRLACSGMRMKLI